jgi:hypothetical protein
MGYPANCRIPQPSSAIIAFTAANYLQVKLKCVLAEAGELVACELTERRSPAVIATDPVAPHDVAVSTTSHTTEVSVPASFNVNVREEPTPGAALTTTLKFATTQSSSAGTCAEVIFAKVNELAETPRG